MKLLMISGLAVLGPRFPPELEQYGIMYTISTVA